MKIKKEKIFLILLLILSLIRFFYKIDERAMFEYDQEFLALEAKKIIVDRKFTLIGAPTSVGGMFIGPLYSYLVALVMMVFKMNPYVINWLTAFLGVVTIVSIYWVSLDLLGFIPAFFASITALLSFYFLDGVPPLAQPLALTSLLIFWSLLKVAENKKYFLLVALLTGWAFNLHFSAIFFPVLILIFILTNDILPACGKAGFPRAGRLSSVAASSPPLEGRSIRRQENKSKLTKRQIFYPILLFLILVSPLFLFELRHNFLMSQNFLNFLRENSGLKVSWWVGLVRAFKIDWEHLASLFFVNNFFVQCLIVLISLPLALKTLCCEEKRVFKAFLIWLITPVLLFSFYQGHIIPYYFLLQEIILFLCTGLFFNKLWQRKILRIMVMIFFFIFIKENLILWASWQTSRSLKNKIRALEFVKAHSHNQPIYLSHTMEPGIDGGFSYLEWYLKINHKEDRGLPIYTLVAPAGWHNIKSEYVFGDYGVNLPKFE